MLLKRERAYATPRGQRVIIDADLAALYDVPTKRLNEAVKRNLAKFPVDFMFTLTESEFANLRSQSATSSAAHGGRRYLPRVFTKHGALMAATLRNSPRPQPRHLQPQHPRTAQAGVRCLA